MVGTKAKKYENLRVVRKMQFQRFYYFASPISHKLQNVFSYKLHMLVECCLQLTPWSPYTLSENAVS